MTQDQIVEAAVRLLGDLPIEEVTTRQLAVALGVSQPALFRHFATREALFLAVVARARADVEQMATELLAQDLGALATLERLGIGLLARVAREPGLPRLLFATAPGDDPLRRGLRQLVSMQVALVGELVAQGQRAGEIAGDVPPDAAASLFVALVQGQVMQWEAGEREGSLVGRFAAPFALWCRAVTGTGLPLVPPSPAKGAPVRLLDVRPILAGGTDPLGAILAAQDALPRGGVLALIAPFRPTPLLLVLHRRGCVVTDEALGDGQVLVIAVAGGPAITDLRDLEPPEPLERVLSARVGPGEVWIARLPRFPALLVPRLEARGLTYAILTLPDETALLRIEGR